MRVFSKFSIAFSAILFLSTFAYAEQGGYDDRYALALFPEDPLAVADIHRCHRLVSNWASRDDFSPSSRDQLVLNYWGFLESRASRDGHSNDMSLMNGEFVEDESSGRVNASDDWEGILTCMKIAGGAIGEMPFEEITIERIFLDQAQNAGFRRLREHHIEFLKAFSDVTIIDCTAMSFANARLSPQFSFLYGVTSQELVRRIETGAIDPFELSSSSELWRNLSDWGRKIDIIDADTDKDVGACVSLNDKLLVDQRSWKAAQ